MNRTLMNRWRPAFPFLLASLAIPAFSQLSYQGCADVTAKDFTMVTLASNATDPTLQEPIKMALDKNAQGNVDVYFTQRYGQVRKYDGTSHATTTLMNLAYGADSIDPANSEGLIGIALDPGFQTNKWIYLFIGIKDTWRLSRFTLSGDKIAPASERPILRIATGNSKKHVAGAIRFDWDGNLWMTVADDESKFTASNTAEMRGKILRIKPRPFADSQSPTPGLGSTYDVPAGNLFAPGTAKTLPEIYVMGVRNPYSIALDPVRKGVAWGDVGPDNFSGSSTDPAQFTEEHNYTTKPGNFGWPYWAGNNIQLDPGGGTPQQPANGLPPAIPAINPFARAAAITGPIYYYDGANPSTVKFPPHFNGAWLVGDLNRSWVDAIALNAAGTTILSKQRIIPEGGGLTNPLDMLMGSDGALYVVNYAGYRTTSSKTGLIRVEYRGACHPTTGLLSAVPLPGMDLHGLELTVSGPSACEARDPSGRLEWSRKDEGALQLDLRKFLRPGLHLITVSTAAGKFAAKVVR